MLLELGIPKLFADTSKIPEIAKMVDTGAVYGVTTNPLIVTAEALGKDPDGYYQEVVRKFSHLPVSIQLLDADTDTLLSQARNYAKLGSNVVVKVPMFPDGRGLHLVNKLLAEGIKVNVTALMTTEQLSLALVSGKGSQMKGPNYLSLFFNRIRDGGGSPTLEIKRSRVLLERCGSGSEIIAGSIRSGQDVTDAFLAGAHIVTVTPKVFWGMISHPKSEEFINQCQAKWTELTQPQIKK